MYDPNHTKIELPPPPKIQAPRQVIELERIKGRSKLPEIQRTSTYNIKKFGFGNLDIVEPGELVSNIKLRLINKMLIRQQSDFGSNSKSQNKNRSEKLNLIPSYTNKKYDSDNEEKKEKKIRIKKKLTSIIKKINDKKVKSKIGLYFKKWKNPLKYIKNLPIVRGINIMDCAPPPRQEKKSSPISVVFLSKSLGKESKPYYLENGKNNDNNKNEKKLINIERVNIERRESNSPDLYKKDSKLHTVQNSGRIKFVHPTQKENTNDYKTENINKNNKIKQQNEEEEEEDEELKKEDYELSGKKSKNNKSKNILRFDSNSSDSSKNEYQMSSENSLIKSKENNENIKEKVIKENAINDSFNIKKIINEENNLINESIEKYKLLSSEIFKVNKLGNRAKNDVINLMRNIPKPLFKNINPEIFINFSKKYYQNCAAYHIYSLYALFNISHEFYVKRAKLYKWKKLINKNSNKYNNKTKFNYYDCENNHCRGCICFRKGDSQTLIKRILIKYILMKEYNPVKYYLYLWHKKTYQKKKE